MKKPSLMDLDQMMDQLLDPSEGCLWCQQQTFESLTQYTLEEAYEVSDAIDRKDYIDLKGECADLLFQVLFYAGIAKQKKLFTLHDIAQHLIDKMHQRNPHVFSDTHLDDLSSIAENWENTKAEERKKRLQNGESLLADVPVNLPALSKAQKLQQRAKQVHFDWPTIEGVYAKLDEEIDELKAEQTANPDPARLEAEMGDILFTCVNLARHLHIDPEAALRHACQTFITRFQTMEERAKKNDKTLLDFNLNELETLWQQSK